METGLKNATQEMKAINDKKIKRGNKENAKCYNRSK